MKPVGREFRFSDGRMVRIGCADYVISEGSICVVCALSKLNKKLKRRGELCVFTGKYREYTDISGSWSTISPQVRYLSDNKVSFICMDYLFPEELKDSE